jgi:hypothetical protein
MWTVSGRLLVGGAGRASAVQTGRGRAQRAGCLAHGLCRLQPAAARSAGLPRARPRPAHRHLPQARPHHALREVIIRITAARFSISSVFTLPV